MKSIRLCTLVMSLMLLVGCGSDQTELRSYLGEIDQSNEAMWALANEHLAWRQEFEPQVGSADFPWESAHDRIRYMVGAMEAESARLSGLEAPEQAMELRRHTLDFYEASTEIYRRQFEVFELLERLSNMQQQANPDQAVAQALLARYEEVQTGLEELAEQVRAAEGKSRAERERLVASL
ncbi:MAG: hypothetical protein JJU31_09570 [Wenzhouxiangella sp.]|nr:hypothetical protein [Wenzhouxiangella sp.]MCH8479023.1 hypothetical protein [Wenzhouxiangella sp.]